MSSAWGPGIFSVQMPGGVPGAMVRVGIEQDISVSCMECKGDSTFNSCFQQST